MLHALLLSATTSAESQPAFSRGTGARQGEVLRLKFTDIFFKPTPHAVFRDTKVQGEDRVIPLVGEALEVIQRRYDMRIDDDRIFPIDKDKLLRRLRAAQKQAGVEELKAKNCHALRHNAVSKMWEKNIDLKTIMATVGHKNIATTLRVYSHTQLDEKARALAALAA